MGSLIVKTRNLVKKYVLGSEEVVALAGVNLNVYRGEFLSVMGPSGSGKTTLLNMIGGLDWPTSGAVYVDGVNLATLNDNELAVMRARKIGFVFQAFNLISILTALENVMLPAYFRGDIKEKEARERAIKLLELVGLSDRIKHRPYELSAGQQQRVALARALINDPALVLADEPTGNLDSKTGKQIILLLKKLNRELGQTFIIVTHDPSVAEETDKTLRILDGQIIGTEIRGENPIVKSMKKLRLIELKKEIALTREKLSILEEKIKELSSSSEEKESKKLKFLTQMKDNLQEELKDLEEELKEVSKCVEE